MCRDVLFFIARVTGVGSCLIQLLVLCECEFTCCGEVELDFSRGLRHTCYDKFVCFFLLVNVSPLPHLLKHDPIFHMGQHK